VELESVDLLRQAGLATRVNAPSQRELI
jgi:hypothetical protein